MVFINEQLILLDEKVKNPKEAIQKAGKLLQKEKKATAEYTSAMQKNWVEWGAYIVIAPSIALPHARPEHGALETAFSIIRLQNPIPFGHEINDPVCLVCAFTAVNQTQHITLLQKVVHVFNDKQKIIKIKQTQQKQEIVAMFHAINK